MKNSIAMSAFILFLVFSTLAVAQTGKFGIGGHGTFYSAASDEEEREFAFGVQARARISERLGLEASMEFREETIEEATVTMYPIQFSALIYLLPRSRVGIYGIVGMGWTRTSVSGSFFDEESINSEISYHFGAGVEIPLTQNFTVNGDFRYLDLNIDLSSIFSGDLNTSGWQSNFGVNVYF